MLATLFMLFELVALTIGLVLCVYVWEDYPTVKTRLAVAVSFIGILFAMMVL